MESAVFYRVSRNCSGVFLRLPDLEPGLSPGGNIKLCKLLGLPEGAGLGAARDGAVPRTRTPAYQNPAELNSMENPRDKSGC